jgi:hypothetical protein
MFSFGNKLTAITGSTASVAVQSTLPDIARDYHERMPDDPTAGSSSDPPTSLIFLSLR